MRSRIALASGAPAELSARPVLVLTAGRTVAFAATFAIPLVLTRALDQTGFGTYKQFFLISATLATIVQFGMAESLFYFMPQTPGRGGRLVMNSLVVLAGAGLACLGLLVLAGPRLSHWLNNDALPGLAGLLGVYLLLMLPSMVLEIVMTARQRYGTAAATYGVSDLLRAVALMAPAILWGKLEWVLAGVVAFAAVRLSGTLLYLGREFGAELRPHGAILREQLAYAIPFQLGVVLGVLEGNLHYYAVAASVSAATFAIYAVGCLQIPLVDLVFTPASNVMMVRMSEAIAARRSELVRAIWDDTTRKMALIFFPLVGLLLVTGRELIVVLFTVRYAASVPIFMVWSAAIVLATLQTDGVLRAYADTRALVAIYAVRVLVIAGLIGRFMSAFGLVGAVLTTALAGALGKCLGLVRVRSRIGGRLADILPWRSLLEILLAVIGSALVAVAVKLRLTISPLPLLIATAGSYTATYLGILAVRAVLTTQDAGGKQPCAGSPAS